MNPYGRTLRASLAALTTLLGLVFPGSVEAAPVLRFTADSPGGHAVIGQTLGYDCGSGQAPPPDSTVACSGILDGDSAPDLYWRDQNASVAVAAVDARTSAALILPAGSTVLHARLYWGALRANEAPDREVTLDREGGFTATVAADDSRAVPTSGPLVGVAYVAYQSSADVTAIVRANGGGSYRVTGVDAIALNGVLSENAFSAWNLVVIYSLAAGSNRRLALYDALDPVTPTADTFVDVGGFAIPAGASPEGSLAAWSYEGDGAQTGDSLRIKGSTVSNGLNPADNFWNESRTGAGVAAAGTIPALTGQPRTGAGFDLDDIDIGPLLANGDISLRVTAASTLDEYWFGGFVVSIASDGPPPGLDGGSGGADGGGGVVDGGVGDGGSGDGGGGMGTGDGGAQPGTDGGISSDATLDGGRAGDSSGSGGDAGAADGGGSGPSADGGSGIPDAGPLGPDESVIAEGSGCRCGIGARSYLPAAVLLPWILVVLLALGRRARFDRR